MQAVYRDKLTTASEAVRHIRSGDGVYLHSNAGVPRTLIDAMVARAPELKGVHIYQLITFGAAPYADLQYADSFHVHCLFIGANLRQAVNDGRADYTSVFFSDLPRLFYGGKLSVDVVLLQVSSPDHNGDMSYGLSLDCTLAAKEHARVVIAEVNRQMPRTYSKHKINVNDVNFIVEADYALPEVLCEEPGDVELAIGKNVASLVEDGATIQLGIGGIPNAVLRSLSDKRDLGVHSEMVSDGIIDLVRSGVITNSQKTVAQGKIAVSFMFGSQKLYHFVHDNPIFEFYPTEFINDPFTIAANHKMTAINAALQIDLTGQVCADSLGTELYSGCGGQVDFVRGAGRSEGGKAIIALPSTAQGGKISRISPRLTPGAGVVTTRADVQYIVTEFGIADLRGMNMKDRVQALIAIAHPNFRNWLEQESASFRWLGNKTVNCPSG